MFLVISIALAVVSVWGFLFLYMIGHRPRLPAWVERFCVMEIAVALEMALVAMAFLTFVAVFSLRADLPGAQELVWSAAIMLAGAAGSYGIVRWMRITGTRPQPDIGRSPPTPFPAPGKHAPAGRKPPSYRRAA